MKKANSQAHISHIYLFIYYFFFMWPSVFIIAIDRHWIIT